MPFRAAVALGLFALLVTTTNHRARAAQAQDPPAQATQAKPDPVSEATPQAQTLSREERIARSLARHAALRMRGGELYAKYCTECHGKSGEGHIADNANSLRSRTFLASVNPLLITNTIRFGRPTTAMAAYHESFGGPLADDDIAALAEYVTTLTPVTRAKLGTSRSGNPERGRRVYRAQCESCHGPQGKGPLAPSLNDPLFLHMSSEPFLRYAITEGRDGTTMPPFGQTLSEQDIDDVAAYLVSWSRRWIKPGAVRLKPTSLSEAVLNPKGPPAGLGPLRDDLYVTVPALKKAMDRGSRLILLDARVPSAWAGGHIPGAVPLPYSEVDQTGSLLPNDGTWIVAYCECPTALSRRVVSQLRTKGYKSTAVLDEGLYGWIARRFPLTSGVVEKGTQ